MTDIVMRLREGVWGRARRADAVIQANMQEGADEIERLRLACTKMNDEVCQRLGKALGYPWFKDDQTNFSGATEENGVCTGEHVAESIAAEAAAEIERLRAQATAAEAARDKLLSHATNAALPALARADRAEAERDRLRETLRDCVETWRPLLADADLTAHENPAYLTLMRADLALGEDRA